MTETGWEERMNGLRQQLTSIKSRVHADSTRFKELWRQAEYCKVRFLAYQLEARRRSLARSRGFASLAENKRGLYVTLGTAVGASILTGMITKDGIAAANAGATGLNRALQGLGEADWAVCLGRKHLAVASQDNITRGDVWVTWDSLQTALHELEERAKSGASLGSLDNIISELKKSKKLLFVIRASTGRATK